MAVSLEGDAEDWDEFVDEHRDRIESIAKSDSSDAWVFQAILDYADSEGSA